jgi:hypothetical protein
MITNVKGVFEKFKGTVNIDDKDISKSKVEVSIEMASVKTDSADLDKHLKSDDFFAIEPANDPAALTVHSLQQAGALALVRRDAAWLLRPRPEAMEGVADLDSSRLDHALASIGGCTVRYQHGIDHVRAAVANGDADAGVLLRPVTVAQIVAIADGGERMPPKSTFFEPKPLTGLVFRSLD